MVCCPAGRPGRLSASFSSSIWSPFSVALTLLALVLLLVLPSAAAAGTLAGRVLDPADRPVPTARVAIMRGAAVVAIIESSAEGRFGPVTLPASQIRSQGPA